MRNLFIFLFILFFIGCAQVKPKPTPLSPEARASLRSFVQTKRNIPESEVPDSQVQVPAVVISEAPKLLVPDRPEVRKQIHHYTAIDPKFVELGLKRRAKLEPIIYNALRERDLPLELINVAFIESCFKLNAMSKKRARGMWQFIKSTGRAYGLKINVFTDERLNPVRSSKAAAKFLDDLYQEFGDWHLAIAAYNGGGGRVRRAIKATGSRDFFVLARSGHLRGETALYVPKVLAMTHINRNLKHYGFE